MRVGGGAFRRACLFVGLVLVVPLALLGCGAGEPVAAPPIPADALTLPPDDVVDLTIYLRRGDGDAAGLVPVTRQVPLGEDLPRAALSLLLEGPAPGDDPALEAALPPEVAIRALQVVAGEAEVDLSATLLSAGSHVMRGPADELLALAAIANTMTEFPGIDQVRLRVGGRSSGSVDGHDVAAFWGYWGLPAVLVRDESVILRDVTARREPLLSFGRLRTDPQDVGVAGAGPVTVPTVRVEDRICSVRITVELAEPGATTAAATALAVPASRVIPVGGDVLLQIDGVMVDEGVPGDLTPEAAEGIERISVDSAAAGTLKIRVERHADGVEPPRVWLHAMDAPTRVVLDIQK